jgi:hypothetical protein
MKNQFLWRLHSSGGQGNKERKNILCQVVTGTMRIKEAEKEEQIVVTGSIILEGMTWKSSLLSCILVLRSEGENHLDITRKSVPRRGNSTEKGTETRTSLE